MKIKDYFNKEYAISLARKITKVYPTFNSSNFIKQVENKIQNQEYTEKMLIFVEIFDTVFPNYLETLKIFEKILDTELSSFADMYNTGMWLAPISKYVEIHSIDSAYYYKASVHFIEELTKRYTGEFAMRPLIVKYPKRSLKIIEKWSKSNNIYLRRLSSECIRISLPWAKKMTTAIENFDEYKKILDNLKNNPNSYVQRSVANNLNDLYKYDKNLFFKIVDEWKKNNPTEYTNKIIKHGSRTYIKEQKK